MMPNMTVTTGPRLGRGHGWRALAWSLAAGMAACGPLDARDTPAQPPSEDGASSTDASIADAGAGADVDAAPLPDCDAAPPLLASSYPATCALDSDCVAVAPGGAVCDPCAFICQTTAIDSDGAARYTTAMMQAARTYAVARAQLACASGCPLLRGPCCIAGQCQMGNACPTPAADGGRP